MVGEDAQASIVAQAMVRARDLFSHDKPGALPFNPNGDSTKWSAQQVMQAYQYLTGLHSFAIVELAQLDAEIAALDFNMRIIQKRLIVEVSGSKRKKYDIDAEITMNSEHMLLSKRKAEKAIMRTVLEATAKGLETKAACLSRDLTRRQMEHDMTKGRAP